MYYRCLYQKVQCIIRAIIRTCGTESPVAGTCGCDWGSMTAYTFKKKYEMEGRCVHERDEKIKLIINNTKMNN